MKCGVNRLLRCESTYIIYITQIYYLCTVSIIYVCQNKKDRISYLICMNTELLDYMFLEPPMNKVMKGKKKWVEDKKKPQRKKNYSQKSLASLHIVW